MNTTQNIPALLRARDQWCLWKLIERDGEKTKVPFGIDGKPAKSNDPATWSTFESVAATFANGGGYDGLGFVFSAADEFVGIDLDGCRNPTTGELAPWAAEQIDALDTYSEISPSQTGVKLWAIGKSPLSNGRKRQLDDEPRICDKAPAIEMYDRGRYFCVTGQRLPGPDEPQERQAQLDIIAKFRFADDEPRATLAAKAPRIIVQSGPSVLDRARKYLSKFDPAISGEGGHDATFRAACVLVCDFALGHDDALALLREFNQRCQPPWTERELEHKVDDAFKQPGERGRLLGNVPTTDRATGEFTIERLTSAEFDAGDFQAHYLIDDVLTRGEPLVVAAALKTMKTTVSVAMGVSLALARPFLGRFDVCDPVNVLIISGESGRSTLQSAGRRIAASYGLDLADVSKLFWAFSLPRLGNIEHLEALDRAINRDSIDVLICDPLYFMLPGEDAGNLMIVGGYLRPLSALCEQLGVTLVVVHHIKRTGIDNRHDPPELSHISWSGTAEWARQWLLLSRRRDYVPGTGEHALWLVVGGSAGHSGLHALNIHEGIGDGRTWVVDVLEPDEARTAEAAAKETAREKQRQAAQAAQLERDGQAIIKAVLKLKDKRGTKTEIKERMARHTTAFNAAFAALLDSGDLVPRQITKGNNRTYDGYAINPKTEVV